MSANVKKEIFEWIKSFAVALIVVALIRTFVFTMIRVEGNSMMETLQDGDRVASTIIDMKLNGPKRFDIVITTYPGETKYVVKRVIGLPGETVEIKQGVTHVNGKPIEEAYVTHPTPNDQFPALTLSEDEYFVMGDNRFVSKDSRMVGPVTRDVIKAKVRLRLWPMNAMGVVE